MQLRIARIVCAAALATGAALALTPAPTSAQQQLPRGSYLNSCTNLVVADGVLTGSCRTADGSQRVTSLANAFGCANGVVNANGRMVCDAPPAPAASPQGMAKFESSCPGANFYVVRIAGSAASVFQFRLDYGQKVHFSLPRDSTYALRCDGFANPGEPFHTVNFE